jgi:probable HAF family extracellular repeat protein
MRPLYYLSALGLSCALLGTPSVPAQTYSIQDLGIPPQAQFSGAAGINQSGQVIGNYGTNVPVSPLSSFVYSDGKVTLLDFFAEGIAGDDRKNPWEEGDNRKLRITGLSGDFAVLYQDNFLRTLGTLPGSSDSIGYAVNSSGEVAGVALYLTGSDQAFLYKNGSMINLGTLPGGSGAEAWAINDAGDVTGVSAIPNGFGYGHAFLHHQDKMIDLGTVPGASVSWGLAINNSLQVAGYSFSADFSIFHAFVWSNGKIKDLGILPSGSQSMANSINSWGQVVGTADVGQPGSPGNFLDHGFLYSNGTMYDLNSLVPPNSGWVILYAEGINDKGEIAATGTLNGAQHALLLQPSVSCCTGSPVKLTVKDGQGFFWDGGGSEFGRTALQVYKDYPSTAQNWTWQPVSGGFTICTLNTVCLSDNGIQVMLGKKADVFTITNIGAVLDRNTGRYIQNASEPANGTYLSMGPLASEWSFSRDLH